MADVSTNIIWKIPQLLASFQGEEEFEVHSACSVPVGLCAAQELS
ncbi:MAG: hypothetical protein U0R19_36080 [Bryobacteraceae bacterium]